MASHEVPAGAKRSVKSSLNYHGWLRDKKSRLAPGTPDEVASLPDAQAGKNRKRSFEGLLPAARSLDGLGGYGFPINCTRHLHRFARKVLEFVLRAELVNLVANHQGVFRAPRHALGDTSRSVVACSGVLCSAHAVTDNARPGLALGRHESHRG